MLGTTFVTKRCGPCEVVAFDAASRSATVVFSATGYTRSAVKLNNLKRGAVRDPMAPLVEGHGYLGVGPHRATSGGIANPTYTMWHNMLQRCYREEARANHPKHAGHTVAPVWLNFQTFAADVEAMPSFGLPGYVFMLKDGHTMYSKGACYFRAINRRAKRIAQLRPASMPIRAMG